MPIKSEAARKRHNENRKKVYWANIEESRRKEREKKKAQYWADPEKERAKRREYYRRNAEKLREIINEAKIRRDPARGVRKALKDYEQGKIEFAALKKIYDNRKSAIKRKVKNETRSTY